MESLPHGGDWASFAKRYGRNPLDFSASISPLGLPQGVAAALSVVVGRAAQYPDPLCRALREGLSAAEGSPIAKILCGNGAADLIYRAVLARRPRTALVCAPAFGEYEAALALVDCRVERHFLKESRDFRPDESLIDAVTAETELVFLCQPNNPTGVTAPRQLAERLLRRCQKVGALLVVDECFCGLLDEPEQITMRGFLQEFPNLLILKAFTKCYAMAGLRLGYALCWDERVLAAMGRAGPPWAVSVPAQEAGIAALAEGAYMAQLRDLIATQRPRLATGLAALGLRVIPGEANFLLFHSFLPLVEPLARRGILLRNCGNFAGLGEEWYRIAVRTEPENGILLEALQEIFLGATAERRARL